MSQDDGGRAFPVVAVEAVPTGFMGNTEWRITANGGGMSLRDYFAAMAMQGMLASDSTVDRTKVKKNVWSRVAYEFADAMLAERKKP